MRPIGHKALLVFSLSEVSNIQQVHTSDRKGFLNVVL